jgi:hypothetical protein
VAEVLGGRFSVVGSKLVGLSMKSLQRAAPKRLEGPAILPHQWVPLVDWKKVVDDPIKLEAATLMCIA